MWYQGNRRRRHSPSGKKVGLSRHVLFILLVVSALLGAGVFAAAKREIVLSKFVAKDAQGGGRAPVTPPTTTVATGNNSSQKGGLLVGSNFRISQTSAA